MTRPRSFLAAASVAALLAGCNSSNNGTAVFAPDSFSVVAPSTSVAVNGTARVLSLTKIEGSSGYEEGVSGYGIDEGTNPALVEIAFTVGLDAERNINSLRVVSADLGLDQALDDTNATVQARTFNTDTPNSLETNKVIGELNDGSFSVAATTGTEVADYNYQVFGSWSQTKSTISIDKAYFSAGFETAAAGVPTSGTMRYEGVSSGVYTYNNGPILEFTSNVTMDVDFGEAQSFTFATTDTSYFNQFNETHTLHPTFDLSGGGALSGSSMSGAVTAGSGPFAFSGTVQAQLYGPAADEIGGTFAVSASSSLDQRYTGSFGGAAVIPE
jgi:hypothetical protein